LKRLDEKRFVLEKVPRLSEVFGFLGGAKTAKVLAKERKKESMIESHRDEELRRV
jgi:hypothetical protein